MDATVDGLKANLLKLQNELKAKQAAYNAAISVTTSLKNVLQYNDILVTGYTFGEYAEAHPEEFLPKPLGSGFFYPSTNPNLQTLSLLFKNIDTIKKLKPIIDSLTVQIKNISDQIAQLQKANISETISKNTSAIIAFFSNNLPLIVISIVIIIFGVSYVRNLFKKTA